MPEVTIPQSPNIPRDDDIRGFVQAMGALETEEVPYRADVLAGTKAIPADIAGAIESLLDGAVEKKGKQEIYTMYDQYGIPSKVDGLRISMMLREKNPSTGKPVFYARPPADAPRIVVVDPDDLVQVDALIKGGEAILVAGRCNGCNKMIAENPHLVRPMRLTDREDAWWRVNQMKFPHMRSRHPMLLPRVYRNKEQRDALTDAAIQAAK